MWTGYIRLSGKDKWQIVAKGQYVTGLRKLQEITWPSERLLAYQGGMLPAVCNKWIYYRYRDYTAGWTVRSSNPGTG